MSIVQKIKLKNEDCVKRCLSNEHVRLSITFKKISKKKSNYRRHRQEEKQNDATTNDHHKRENVTVIVITPVTT